MGVSASSRRSTTGGDGPLGALHKFVLPPRRSQRSRCCIPCLAGNRAGQAAAILTPWRGGVCEQGRWTASPSVFGATAQPKKEAGGEGDEWVAGSTHERKMIMKYTFIDIEAAWDEQLHEA